MAEQEANAGIKTEEHVGEEKASEPAGLSLNLSSEQEAEVRDPPSEQPAKAESNKKTARFMVENVDSPSPTKSPLHQNDAFEYNTYPDPSDTIGFPTHEAVPMTVFYRNQASVGDGAAQRPTLKSLHQGLDELDEENMEEVPLEGSSTGLDVEVKSPSPSQKLKFGWCKGVLVPCLLNIWGVILYLRLPWLTGQAGMGYMTLIILLAAVVTTITTMSMSAICTNGQIKGGC